MTLLPKKQFSQTKLTEEGPAPAKVEPNRTLGGGDPTASRKFWTYGVVENDPELAVLNERLEDSMMDILQEKPQERN